MSCSRFFFLLIFLLIPADQPLEYFLPWVRLELWSDLVKKILRSLHFSMTKIHWQKKRKRICSLAPFFQKWNPLTNLFVWCSLWCAKSIDQLLFLVRPKLGLWVIEFSQSLGANYRKTPPLRRIYFGIYFSYKTDFHLKVGGRLKGGVLLCRIKERTILKSFSTRQIFISK